MSLHPGEFEPVDQSFIKSLVDKVVTNNIFSDKPSLICSELKRVPDIYLKVELIVMYSTSLWCSMVLT